MVKNNYDFKEEKIIDNTELNGKKWNKFIIKLNKFVVNE